jgi:carbonic anhydrase
MWSAA